MYQMMVETKVKVVPKTHLQKVVRAAVSSMVPRGAKKRDGTDLVESYTEHYNCCPPPLFIVIISAVEVCPSVCLSVSLGGVTGDCSPLRQLTRNSSGDEIPERDVTYFILYVYLFTTEP